MSGVKNDEYQLKSMERRNIWRRWKMQDVKVLMIKGEVRKVRQYGGKRRESK